MTCQLRVNEIIGPRVETIITLIADLGVYKANAVNMGDFLQLENWKRKISVPRALSFSENKRRLGPVS